MVQVFTINLMQLPSSQHLVSFGRLFWSWFCRLPDEFPQLPHAVGQVQLLRASQLRSDDVVSFLRDVVSLLVIIKHNTHEIRANCVTMSVSPNLNLECVKRHTIPSDGRETCI